MITSLSSLQTRRDAVLHRGVDASPDRRPGIPMETTPQPVKGAHWSQPDRQVDPGNVLKRKNLDQLTPVFGTATPPRGLSGVMRRLAYKLPEHAPSHWAVLMLADRVDALEHNPWRSAAMVVPIAAGVYAFARWRSSKYRSRK